MLFKGTAHEFLKSFLVLDAIRNMSEFGAERVS